MRDGDLRVLLIFEGEGQVGRMGCSAKRSQFVVKGKEVSGLGVIKVI